MTQYIGQKRCRDEDIDYTMTQVLVTSKLAESKLFQKACAAGQPPPGQRKNATVYRLAQREWPVTRSKEINEQVRQDISMSLGQNFRDIENFMALNILESEYYWNGDSDKIRHELSERFLESAIQKGLESIRFMRKRICGEDDEDNDR